MVSIKYYYDLSLKRDGISVFSKAAKLFMLMQYKETYKFMTSNSCSVTPKDNSNLMLQDIKEIVVRVRKNFSPLHSSPQYRIPYTKLDILLGRNCHVVKQ